MEITDDNANKTLKEIKASMVALKKTVVEMLSKGSTPEEVKNMETAFEKMFVNNLTQTTGVDVFSNLSVGRVILTKYIKEETARRWEINEGTTSINETSN